MYSESGVVWGQSLRRRSLVVVGLEEIEFWACWSAYCLPQWRSYGEHRLKEFRLRPCPRFSLCLGGEMIYWVVNPLWGRHTGDGEMSRQDCAGVMGLCRCMSHRLPGVISLLNWIGVAPVVCICLSSGSCLATSQEKSGEPKGRISAVMLIQWLKWLRSGKDVSKVPSCVPLRVWGDNRYPPNQHHRALFCVVARSFSCGLALYLSPFLLFCFTFPFIPSPEGLWLGSKRAKIHFLNLCGRVYLYFCFERLYAFRDGCSHSSVLSPWNPFSLLINFSDEIMWVKTPRGESEKWDMKCGKCFDNIMMRWRRGIIWQEGTEILSKYKMPLT